MSDQSQRTEKPTQRRLQKAREQGRFPVSKEALSAVMFTVAVVLTIRFFPDWIELWQRLTRFLVGQAFTNHFSERTALRIWQMVLIEGMTPLLTIGALVVTAGFALQVAMTGFGFAHGRLQPELSRLNPASRLKQLPGQNLFSAAQSVMLLAALALIVVFALPGWFDAMRSLPLRPLPVAIAGAGAAIEGLLWKAVFLFLILGSVDYVRQRMKHMRELRMTKQEVRDEHKENEGNPQIKQKVRRLQRDALRRRMMEKVPTATAVIVNPTHYSVAIHYDLDSMAAPRVVAKGKNYLARRIRETAIANEVPIVENPPLARSLYKAVDVGHEIPAALYRAVAEVLAYIYRLMNGRRR